MVTSFISSCRDLLFLNISSTINFKNKKQKSSATQDFYIAEVWYIKVQCTAQWWQCEDTKILICDLDPVPSALRRHIYSHALQLPKRKTEQNKNPEMTHYTPPWHLGISACSIKCQSSSFHFWSFWQLIPFNVLYSPAPDCLLFLFRCQKPQLFIAVSPSTATSLLCAANSSALTTI